MAKNLTVSLRGDITDFEKKFKAAQRQHAEFRGAMKRDAKVMVPESRSFDEGVGAISKFAGYFTAATGAAYTMTKAVTASVGRTVELARAGRELDVLPERMQAITAAADVAGVSIDDMMKRLEGSKTQTDYINALEAALVSMGAMVGDEGVSAVEELNEQWRLGTAVVKGYWDRVVAGIARATNAVTEFIAKRAGMDEPTGPSVGDREAAIKKETKADEEFEAFRKEAERLQAEGRKEAEKEAEDNSTWARREQRRFEESELRRRDELMAGDAAYREQKEREDFERRGGMIRKAAEAASKQTPDFVALAGRMKIGGAGSARQKIELPEAARMVTVLEAIERNGRAPRAKAVFS